MNERKENAANFKRERERGEVCTGGLVMIVFVYCGGRSLRRFTMRIVRLRIKGISKRRDTYYHACAMSYVSFFFPLRCCHPFLTPLPFYLLEDGKRSLVFL